jgi:hypothetical protein
MKKKYDDMTSGNAEAGSGQAARRKFIKNSGGLAIAAPAVVLLLSAASKTAVAATYNLNPGPDVPTPRTPPHNLLDP